MANLALLLLVAAAAHEEPNPSLVEVNTSLLEDYQFSQPTRQEVGEGRTQVSVENNAAVPENGSWPLRVFLDNSSGPTGPVQLTFHANSGSSHLVTRTVQLQAGERREVNLPVYAELRYGQLSASGPGVGGGVASLYFQSISAPNRLVLSVGRPDAYERFVGHAPTYTGATTTVQTVPGPELPTELFAYSGYDAVVLPEAEALDALEEAQRAALEAYVATGGALVVQGPLRSTRHLPLLGDGALGRHGYGFGTVTIGEQAAGDEKAVRGGLAVGPQARPPEYERRYGGSKFEPLLPQANAPLGTFLLIIGLFTLAIGPGSLLVARKKGPAALLVTIPTTAFVTCVAIIGYSLAADGFAVHSSMYGVTLLDAKSHRAVTVGVAGYYANLSPAPAEYGLLSAVVPASDQHREHPISDLHWGQGLTMGSDYVPSRVYREWGLLSVEPTRAHVQVQRRGEEWVLQNALGHEVASAYVRLDGTLYAVGRLRDGEQRPLAPTTAKPVLAKPDRFASRVAAMATSVPSGHFVAVLEDHGFMPEGGLHTQLYAGQQLVLGSVEP